MSLLEIRDLRVHLPAGDGVAKAVDGVDLVVGPGESVGIVGESGAGKTVMALSILGLLPDGGEILEGSSIRFRGEELVGLSDERIRDVRGGGIALVFQEPSTSLNPVFSVGAQIAETLQVHKGASRREAWSEAVGLLREVGIADPESRSRDYPHQLSGGMRQRAMIAMALAGEPDLLIADEPTTALDATVQDDILRLLARLQRDRGMGLLLISHDLEAVAAVCERVCVMYGGQVVESGSAEGILREPIHPYSAGLLMARTPTPGDDSLPSIPGEVPEATRWPTGCRFHPRCKESLPRCEEEVPQPAAVEGPEGNGETWARCWLLSEKGPER
jgi:oligopeptide/dipeptide ABC transporter ATP-binding protein